MTILEKQYKKKYYVHKNIIENIVVNITNMKKKVFFYYKNNLKDV